MKAKVFLFVCLFVGFATLSVSAQDKANGANQGWGTFSEGAVGVFCDGVMIDRLEGKIEYHWVSKNFKNVVYREIEQLKGDIKSEVTGETFRIRRTDKWTYTDQWNDWVTYNFIGDMGSVYTGKFRFDYSTFEFLVEHDNCHGYED